MERVSSSWKNAASLPAASASEYPVSRVNFGLTYSILPEGSAMITDTGLCSTAYESLRM
jgi:hypothetical protein